MRTMSPAPASLRSSCAWNFTARRTTFLYFGCSLITSTLTTIVLSPLSETTTPRRSCRRPRSISARSPRTIGLRSAGFSRVGFDRWRRSERGTCRPDFGFFSRGGFCAGASVAASAVSAPVAGVASAVSSAVGSATASSAAGVSVAAVSSAVVASVAPASGAAVVSAVSSVGFFSSSAIYFTRFLSCCTVRIRAISRLASFSRVVFSSAPVTDWKRRLKSSCRVSASLSASSSFVRSRMSLALKEISLPPHELRLDRQLLAGQTQRLLGERLGHSGELEHHAPGLDHDDPALGRALALTHAGLGRLLRERLVREDVDPDLAAALDLARHGDTGGLDLAVRDPAGLERLDPELAELNRALALRLAAAAAAVVLAEGGLLREQHLGALASGAAVLVLRARRVELRRVLVHRLRRRRVG